MDVDGHGTHCTSLAAKFAPNAEIYVGRVFGKSVTDKNSPAIVAKVSIKIYACLEIHITNHLG